MTPLIKDETLARTYSHPSKDPWRAIKLYREATAKPTDWGSHRVASAINSDQSNDFDGVSRSEVRAWVDNDSMPDAMRAVETARNLGWTAQEWTDTVGGIAKLVIGTYAFGSIAKRTYSPSWSPTNEKVIRTIEDALTQVGSGFTHVVRDNPSQGDEIRPDSHATRLGRALAVAGAPVGNKNSRSVTGFPAWSESAPQELKKDLVLLFVRERGVQQEGKATLVVQSDRCSDYFERIAQLIRDITGETVTASEHGVTISANAVRELGLA
jgi:hypothetical protein